MGGRSHYRTKSFCNIMDEETKTYGFYGIMILIHILYIFVFFGVFYVKPEYIEELSSMVQIVISVFLIYRFHPFREWMSLKEPRLTHFDRIIIYNSATFLLVNVGLKATITKYVITKVENNFPVVQGIKQGYLSGVA